MLVTVTIEFEDAVKTVLKDNLPQIFQLFVERRDTFAILFWNVSDIWDIPSHCNKTKPCSIFELVYVFVFVFFICFYLASEGSF